jgi:two-component system, NarL family, response regulator LiaR
MSDPRNSEGSALEADSTGRSGPQQRSLRVVIADDDPLARRVVRDALQEAGMVVVADAASGREAVELALHYRPDLVLMDVVMPEMDGIAASRAINQQAPDVKVVILSMSDDDDLGLLGIRAGALGYVTKDVDVLRLPKMLERVASGEPAVTPRFTARLIDELRGLPEAGQGMRPVRSDLTAREWEVLDLLASGNSTDRIAEELVLSVETVRSHVKSLHRKLGVHSRAELLAVVRRLRTPSSEVS